MPGQFLTTSDRKRLAGFPEEIPEDHLIKYFTQSRTDLLLVKDLRRDRNRLGFSVQLCAVRYLGFCPDNLSETPFPILEYVAGQLNTAASFELLEAYGNRGQTRTDHLNRINEYLGFHKASLENLKDLENWVA